MVHVGCSPKMPQANPAVQKNERLQALLLWHAICREGGIRTLARAADGDLLGTTQWREHHCDRGHHRALRDGTSTRGRHRGGHSCLVGGAPAPWGIPDGGAGRSRISGEIRSHDADRSRRRVARVCQPHAVDQTTEGEAPLNRSRGLGKQPASPALAQIEGQMMRFDHG
jgi:curved DNA-binding protein CbpA